MADEHTIIGVDPGLRVAGYSVLRCDARRTAILECDYIKMDIKAHLSERVKRFHDRIAELILEYQATMIALETPFLGKNAQTFLKLGYLRGILYLLAAQNELVLNEFAPRQVKACVAGTGAASKESVALALFRLFPQLTTLKVTVRNDVTDALAVGLCGAWNVQQEARMARLL